MKKILDIKYPTITTYTQHAHLLAILENEPRAKTWIYSNYIQIFANKELSINRWADFYFPMPYEVRPFELCKWLEVQKNSEEYVDKNCPNIIEYVKSLIDNNYYVHMMINYKYLSRSRYSRRNIDRNHDILIYGYDDDTKFLYCSDFMFETNKYTFSQCTFDELEKAYYSQVDKEKTSYLNHSIYSYKVKSDCDYEYHIKNIMYWIKQYLNSESPEYWNGYNFCNRENIMWGISYHDALLHSLLTVGDRNIDVRFFYLLKDHKKMMCERLLFIERFNSNVREYISEYEEIYSKMTLIVNMVIKYNMVHKDDMVNNIVDKLKEAKNMEYVVLTKILKCLEDG